ncbi:MAG: hypothetical protein ACI835_004805 [Planctomycetota bacterium]|jgi:hypothetical protein
MRWPPQQAMHRDIRSRGALERLPPNTRVLSFDCPLPLSPPPTMRVLQFPL